MRCATPGDRLPTGAMHGTIPGMNDPRDRTPKRIDDVKRGDPPPSAQTVKALDALIDSDPRWADEDMAAPATHREG